MSPRVGKSQEHGSADMEYQNGHLFPDSRTPICMSPGHTGRRRRKRRFGRAAPGLVTPSRDTATRVHCQPRDSCAVTTSNPDAVSPPTHQQATWPGTAAGTGLRTQRAPDAQVSHGGGEAADAAPHTHAAEGVVAGVQGGGQGCGVVQVGQIWQRPPRVQGPQEGGEAHVLTVVRKGAGTGKVSVTFCGRQAWGTGQTGCCHRKAGCPRAPVPCGLCPVLALGSPSLKRHLSAGQLA